MVLEYYSDKALDISFSEKGSENLRVKNTFAYNMVLVLFHPVGVRGGGS